MAHIPAQMARASWDTSTVTVSGSTPVSATRSILAAWGRYHISRQLSQVRAPLTAVRMYITWKAGVKNRGFRALWRLRHRRTFLTTARSRVQYRFSRRCHSGLFAAIRLPPLPVLQTIQDILPQISPRLQAPAKNLQQGKAEGRVGRAPGRLPGGRQPG